jgi:hypothetical protein
MSMAGNMAAAIYIALHSAKREAWGLGDEPPLLEIQILFRDTLSVAC